MKKSLFSHLKSKSIVETSDINSEIINSVKWQQVNITKEDIDKLKEMLYSDDEYLRNAAVYVLFKYLEITDKDIVNKIIEMLNDKNEDFMTKVYIMSAMESLIRKSNNLDFIKLLYNIYRNTKEDEYVRFAALQNLLELRGVDSLEMILDDYSLKDVEKNILKRLKK